MELYYIIAVTDRDRAGEMAELYQAAGLHLTLTKLGRGTAPREALSIYGLDATPKAIVSAVADGEMQKQIFKNAKRRMQIDIPGNGVMLAVALAYSLFRPAPVTEQLRGLTVWTLDSPGKAD